MEAMKKAEFLSPHPFQPSQREKIKTNGSWLFAKPRLNELGDDLEGEEFSRREWLGMVAHLIVPAPRSKDRHGCPPSPLKKGDSPEFPMLSALT
jgi:hypothetical protein